MQKERREQYDDGGLHIVAHGGCGDGGIIVGFEEENPVEADQRARQHEQKQRFAADPFGGAAADAHENAQKRAAQQSAREGEDARGEGNEAPENADRAEDQHGGDKGAIGFQVFFGHERLSR